MIERKFSKQNVNLAKHQTVVKYEKRTGSQIKW